MAITNSTFISETTKFIRDLLQTLITDPISGRSADSFVMSSYPNRETRYPVISVVTNNISAPRPLGIQSEQLMYDLNFEIRVWARSVPKKDQLAEQVIDSLRDAIHTASSGTVANNLRGFTLGSVVDIDEPGKGGVHSKVITITYKYVTN